MQFSEQWLRSFVNPALTRQQLADVLTMAGLEVEALAAVAPAFTQVLVGQVLSLSKHPQADRLNVCQVDVGAAEPLQIVCGASNVHAGAKVPCAIVGAVLPQDFRIKAAKLRGVESSGMLCSAKELGLSDEADGLLLLPADAPVGSNLRDYLALEDVCFTLKLTPNRADCLSLLGIAREVAALTETPLQWNVAPAVVANTTVPHRNVALAAPEACPRYCGRVIQGVNANAATPLWMQQRLERSGLRSISPLVDVTNYVLLEYGQPLHAFDDAHLHGGMTVRWAREGECLTLLNGQDVTLTPDMLVVADERKAQALAGVMGGAASAVSETTSCVFLESAFFAPTAIAGRPRRLGIGSDAAYRFERGVDFVQTRAALERATALILEICGGQAGDITETTVAAQLPVRLPVRLRSARAARLLGVAFTPVQIEKLLLQQQIVFVREADDFTVTPPSWRFDLSIEEDFVEELARIYGYDNIPAQVPTALQGMLPQAEKQRPVASLKNRLVDRDYQEVVTFSFVEEAWERDFAGNVAPVRLLNPIASQLAVMRSSLLGSLVQILRQNLNHKQTRVRLFEVGTCFLQQKAESGVLQPERLAGLAYGFAQPEQWGLASRHVDFYDVKADVEALLGAVPLRWIAAEHPALHPGKSAQVWLGETLVGWVGELHPQWLQRYDLPKAPVVFELEMTALQSINLPQYQEFARLPAVRRDVALVVDESVHAQALLDVAQSHAPATLHEVRIFDVYRGKGVPDGKKSLAVQLQFQPLEKTLTDTDIEGLLQPLLAQWQSVLGAQLRT